MRNLGALVIAAILGACVGRAGLDRTYDTDEFRIETIVRALQVVSGPAGRRDCKRFEVTGPDVRIVVSTVQNSVFRGHW
jgi:hypothetical protein